MGNQINARSMCSQLFSRSDALACEHWTGDAAGSAATNEQSWPTNVPRNPQYSIDISTQVLFLTQVLHALLCCCSQGCLPGFLLVRCFGSRVAGTQCYAHDERGAVNQKIPNNRKLGTLSQNIHGKTEGFAHWQLEGTINGSAPNFFCRGAFYLVERWRPVKAVMQRFAGKQSKH